MTITDKDDAEMANNDPEFSEASTTRTVPENSAADTAVGTPVTAMDDDSGDTLTYTLEGMDADSFDIDPNTGQIKTISEVTYDHEAVKNSYEVMVRASDDEASDTITVTITVTDEDEQSAAPAKPTVTMPPGSATSLDVTWNEPGPNGGPAIAGYDVQYRVGATGEWNDSSHSGTDTSATITGLTPGTGYQVQVQAKNGEMPSAWSPASDTVSTRSLPVLSVADASATEGSAVSFTVQLSPASAEVVTVDWATSVETGDTATLGADFMAASGALTFNANETLKMVAVQTTLDTTDEDHETFTLTLSGPSNAALTSNPTATGTIEDDDDPPTVGVTAAASANEGADVSFTVTLSPASGKTVTVDVATSIGSADTAAAADFTAVSTTLTFDPGQTSKTVAVQTTEDTTDEEDETFTLTLSSPSNATLTGDVTQLIATGTITDNDAVPALIITGESALRGLQCDVHSDADAGERQDGDGEMGHGLERIGRRNRRTSSVLPCRPGR